MSDKAYDERGHDFFIIDNELLDIYLPIIKHPAYVVYSTLVRMADTKGYSFTGVKYLETKTCYSRNTVLQALETLEKYGLIRVKRHKNEGGRDWNEYWIQKVSKSDISKATGSLDAQVDTKPVELMTRTGSIPDTEPVQSVNTNKTESKQYTKRTRHQQTPVAVATPEPSLLLPADSVSNPANELLVQKLIEIGVHAPAAETLVRTSSAAQIRAVLESGALKSARNKAAFARKAIEDGYSVKPTPQQAVEHATMPTARSKAVPRPSVPTEADNATMKTVLGGFKKPKTAL